jgi:hypothetical protein
VIQAGGWSSSAFCEVDAPPGATRPSADPSPLTCSRAGECIDRFSFFFAFYGLILGLAVTELLGGFARIVRARAHRKIEAQTALLALLTFIVICATWIDAWNTLTTISLDFEGLWAPILLATFYYLAASVVFPSDPKEFDQLATYYAERKRFVVGMLLAAELLVSFTFLNIVGSELRSKPALFWLWFLPYNLSIKSCYLALFLVRGRRANIALLVALILLFMVPYWVHGAMEDLISRHYGY